MRKINNNLKDGDLNNLRGKSAEAWMEIVWEELLENFADLKPANLKDALEKLISKAEKTFILRRIAVAALLRKGKTYREIGEILWASPSNISTIKKNILGSGHYKSQRVFKNIKQKKMSNQAMTSSWLDELLQSFKNIDLWELIKNPPRPSGMSFKKHRYYT